MISSRVRGLVARASGTLLLLSMVPTKALAAGSTAGSNVTDAPSIVISGGDLPDIVDKIITTVLWILGVLAVLYLVYGGVQYITAGGDAEKAAKGRTAITNAIIGVIIIAISLALYKFVVGNVITGTTPNP